MGELGNGERRRCSGPAGGALSDGCGLDLCQIDGLVGVHRVPEVDSLLEVEPELGLGAGELRKTERSIRRHAALPLHDLVRPRVRDPETLSRVLLRDPKGQEEVRQEDTSRRSGATVPCKRRIVRSPR